MYLCLFAYWAFLWISFPLQFQISIFLSSFVIHRGFSPTKSGCPSMIPSSRYFPQLCLNTARRSKSRVNSLDSILRQLLLSSRAASLLNFPTSAHTSARARLPYGERPGSAQRGPTSPNAGVISSSGAGLDSTSHLGTAQIHLFSHCLKKTHLEKIMLWLGMCCRGSLRWKLWIMTPVTLMNENAARVAHHPHQFTILPGLSYDFFRSNTVLF